MTTTLLTLTLAVLGADPAPAGKPGEKETPRKPSVIAPSLPQLTKEEEDKLDEIIDSFIDTDIGRLRGAEARKAIREFNKLGPEAIPALIRGLNRAAKINHSCPVLTIGKKLHRLLMASDDTELLQFARDEIGAGVGRTRYAGFLQDLRVKVMVRKNYLARRGPPPPKGPRAMSTADLAKAASTERGPRLSAVLKELEGRKGKEALEGLAVAAGSYDRDTQKLGRELLEKHLARQPASSVKERLKEDQAEVRRAATRVVADKHPSLAGALIDLLDDDSSDVRAEARRALVRVSRGEDFGPPEKATRAQRREAQRKWRDWWKRYGER
jgi:hypothetical protein